jgi:hypothetical protein
MATPTYKGSGQPQVASGFLSGVGSWFGGGGTPAYAGEGQPSSASSGFLGSGTPIYKRSIDAALPQGPFAIVVPRSYGVTDS